MKRLVISVITVLVIVPAGCETVVVDDTYVVEDMYNDRLAYVYDYGEAVPTEAGMYRSGQAALEGVLELENAWTDGVEATMEQVDVIRAGEELEKILGRLYQPGSPAGLYGD
jgi:hypothetical protein